MDGKPTDPASESAGDRSQLIEAIYRIALEPQSYDSFMARWSDLVAERLAARDAGQSELEALNDSELEPHFAIALRLIEQSMPPPSPPDGDRSHGRQARAGASRLLVDAEARIVWHNGAAARALGLERGATLDSLALSPPRRQALAARAATLGQRPAQSTKPLIFSLPDQISGEILHFKAEILTEAEAGEVLMISQITAGWPAAMPALLRDDFGLTPSEVDVCEWIADGRSASQIAELRDSALATVRTQIKKIMAKTRTSAQPELVRLLHLLMRIAEDHAERAFEILPPGPGLRRIELPDRMMPVEIHGPDGGHPVIFFHGMLDGNAITNHCRDLLTQHNLQLICPVRPYFGSAEGDGGAIDTAPQRFAEDIRTLMSVLRLTRPVLLGHMAGAVYAHAAAAALPGDIAGIVNVAGGVPIISASQFAAMSSRQRLVAYTARYSPAILPFILRAGIRQMRTGGERKFLMSLYENAPDDMPFVRDPEVQAILLSGYRFTVAQGHRAFEIDSRHVVSDWSALADASTVPVHLLHGTNDPVVSIASVRAHVAARPERIKLTEMPETGQLVFYKSPDTVLRAVRGIIEQNIP